MILIREAEWYEKDADNKVQCGLCPHYCTIWDGEKGRCKVRENKRGKLYTINYGLAGGYALDPIEKKPLFNFCPGSMILSVGARGCNFRCEFCQNWNLAHGNAQEMEVTPFGLISALEKYKDRYNPIGIAYTYSEPLMWYEFLYNSAVSAKKSGYKTVVVTNGFINQDPLKKLLPYIDAFNIDVKGFNAQIYKNLIHGELKPVLRTAELAKEYGCHVEITNLVIPGHNDSSEEISELVDWVYKTLGGNTPLHFTRFFPNHKLQINPTPIKTLETARNLALKCLNYVYIGNVGDMETSSTYCPNCSNMVIKRSGFGVDCSNLTNSDECKHCGSKLNINC